MSNFNDLIEISGCDNSSRRGDVIFVHGLGGKARGTWHPQGKQDDDNFWCAWLGEDLPDVGIWSLGYEVEPFRWKGNSMPLADRATNSLDLLDSYEIGDRPIIFITHSMGGLLVKQMLRSARDFGRWSAIAQKTRGIVFLSTPHSGSDMASWIKHIGGILQTTVSVEELEAHHSRLRELNLLYRNDDQFSQIPMLVYCETRPTKGILVVNQTSADPGIKGVIPVPMDFDHISICKVADRKSQIYRQVKRFIQDNLVKSLVSTEPNHYPRKNLLPILEPPKNLGCTPKWLWIKFSLPRFITNLSVEFKIILAWCLLCNYFNEKVFREILLITKQDTNFNHRVIWHWIIGLEITQKSTVAEGFYRIKITYKNQNKLLKPFNTKDIHVELVNVFEKCLNTEIDPQYSDLYKAEKIIHQIDGDVYDIPSESIENILSVFRYKPEVVKGVLNSISRLSKRLNNPEIYKNHKIALFIPARGNIDSILIFPAAILLEKSLSRLRHRKFAVFPLYILALVYQTWSSHDKAIETLEKAINLFPDKKPKLVGVLSSRLALSYIMKGQMSQAKECLRDADRVLEYESTEWFDNRLNNQIWLLKRGNWNQALTNSSELEKCIKDPYLKAKQAHILGVNHLYMGNLEKAKEYAYKCEELSSMVTLSSWIIGKAWRNRFAYELLSTIELVEGNFEEAERISKDITRQLTPLFRWILGYTVKNHLLYTRAYISAMIGDLSGAEHQQHQLLQDNHLEAYYCVTSKLNLAEIYSKKDQKVEAAKLYNEMEEEAKRIGFKYLEFRAYKKRNEIYQNQSLDINNERDEYDFKKNSNSYMDGLEFLIPV